MTTRPASHSFSMHRVNAMVRRYWYLLRSSLFRILFEKVLATSRRYRVRVPLYIMTSHATHGETAEYLEAQNRFGLPAEDVRLFCQGQMPAVDLATGWVLLADKHQVALSPDGHGGRWRRQRVRDLRDQHLHGGRNGQWPHRHRPGVAIERQ